MTSMQHWTPEQWAVFAVTIAAGVIAAALLYAARSAVLGWKPPAPLHILATGKPPRPSLVMTERRYAALATALDRTTWIEPSHNVPIIVADDWTDPTLSDFTDHGIGALPTIQALGDTDEMQTSAELAAWVNRYADLSALMPETDAARETMRVNLEPVMRKARLWRVRGEGGPARQQLNDWRMHEHTGEYPMLTTSDLRPYAAALLVS